MTLFPILPTVLARTRIAREGEELNIYIENGCARGNVRNREQLGGDSELRLVLLLNRQLLCANDDVEELLDDDVLLDDRVLHEVRI